MPNPLAGSRLYARIGNVFTRPAWSLLGPPRGFAVLTTTGRRSGKPRRQSVRAIRDGDRVVVVAMMGERAQWLKNGRANPKISLRLHEGTFAGTVREVTDPSEREWARRVYVQTTVANDYFDYAAYEWGLPTRGKIERAHARWFDGGVPVIADIGGEPA